MTRLFFTVLLSAFLLCAFLVLPPFIFRERTVLTVPSGASIRDIGLSLKNAGVIRSVEAFRVLERLSGGHVVSGSYLFTQKENLFSVVYRLRKGISDMEAVKVTLPEGITVKEIGVRIKEALPDFDMNTFTREAESKEGFLFPDTYYLPHEVTPAEVIALLSGTFDSKIEPFQEEIASSGRTLHEIVTMASLIEEEARQSDTRKIVSGILWKRLDAGMPLQVDAVFSYIHETPGYAPTAEDLKTDSPYNTYTRRGLPPTPIANPSLDSIDAALHPVKTPYVYYLTGKDGVMYYARTFEEHIANRRHLK